MNVTGAEATLLALMVGIVGTIFGIYVTLTNKLTDHEARMRELENKAGHVFSKLDEHETKMQDLLNEIKESVHRVEMNIVEIRNERQQQ